MRYYYSYPMCVALSIEVRCDCCPRAQELRLHHAPHHDCASAAAAAALLTLTLHCALRRAAPNRAAAAARTGGASVVHRVANAPIDMSNAAAAVSATPDWGMFWTWATGMFMAGIVTTVAGRALFPIVSPQRWGQMQSDASYHAMPLAKSFSEMLPVFAVPTLIWKDLLKLSSDALATPADSLRLKPTSDVCSATGALLGYMAFDCVFMLCYAADVERSNGKAMFYQLWVHHLVSLFVWPLSLHTNVAVLCVRTYGPVLHTVKFATSMLVDFMPPVAAACSWFLFSEASNFFLTPRTVRRPCAYTLLRWVLKKLKYDEGVLYTCCGLGWLVTFFLGRHVAAGRQSDMLSSPCADAHSSNSASCAVHRQRRAARSGARVQARRPSQHGTSSTQHIPANISPAYTSCHLICACRLLTYTTVPMPLLLNMYWFYLGIRGLLKFLSGKPKSTASIAFGSPLVLPCLCCAKSNTLRSVQRSQTSDVHGRLTVWLFSRIQDGVDYVSEDWTVLGGYDSELYWQRIGTCRCCERKLACLHANEALRSYVGFDDQANRLHRSIYKYALASMSVRIKCNPRRPAHIDTHESARCLRMNKGKAV
eukprot:6209524-Pleurochrysis_carterae.AAC.3